VREFDLKGMISCCGEKATKGEQFQGPMRRQKPFRKKLLLHGSEAIASRKQMKLLQSSMNKHSEPLHQMVSSMIQSM